MTEETKDTQIAQPTEEVKKPAATLQDVPTSGGKQAGPSNSEGVVGEQPKQPKPAGKFFGRGGGRGSGGGGGRGGRRPERGKEEKPEFEQKLLDIRRTARMVSGGRRFSFRALVVIGNKKGKVGVGLAKGADVTIAVEKAVNQAKKVLIEVPINDNKSIPQMIEAKFGAARVMLKPAQKGKGIIAGGAVRVICSLVGIENVVSKIIGRTTNKLNNAQATIEALKKLS